MDESKSRRIAMIAGQNRTLNLDQPKTVTPGGGGCSRLTSCLTGASTSNPSRPMKPTATPPPTTTHGATPTIASFPHSLTNDEEVKKAVFSKISDVTASLVKTAERSRANIHKLSLARAAASEEVAGHAAECEVLMARLEGTYTQTEVAMKTFSTASSTNSKFIAQIQLRIATQLQSASKNSNSADIVRQKLIEENTLQVNALKHKVQQAVTSGLSGDAAL